MLRPVQPGDLDALKLLLTEIGLFGPDDVADLTDMIAAHLAGTLGEGHTWIVDDDGDLKGVAYYAPERMAQGTWNLYLIAVLGERRGSGRGSAILRFVETDLHARGGRLLIVETSGLADFDRTRAFYRKNGYEQEARIRDFYQAGEDKIVFRKPLQASSAGSAQRTSSRGDEALRT